MDDNGKNLKPEDIAWNNIKTIVIESIIHQYIRSKNIYVLTTTDWDDIFYQIRCAKENFKTEYPKNVFIHRLNQDFGVNLKNYEK